MDKIIAIQNKAISPTQPVDETPKYSDIPRSILKCTSCGALLNIAGMQGQVKCPKCNAILEIEK